MTGVSVALARVVQRRTPMAGAVELLLEHPVAASSVQPGQFFQIAVDAPGTVLRRPYSVSWFDPGQGVIALLFSVVGAGSAWLAEREPEDPIDALGPLGQGFQVAATGRPAVCVAGGLGIAAFPALVSRLRELGRPLILLQGARTASQLLPAARLDGAEVRIATDDGSAGHTGPVTDLVSGVLRGDAELFVCGPTPMLQTVMRAAGALGFPLGQIQVALETPMGCGLGTCLGCAVPRRDGGYLLTCQVGPCVRADRVDWENVGDAFHG